MSPAQRMLDPLLPSSFQLGSSINGASGFGARQGRCKVIR